MTAVNLDQGTWRKKVILVQVAMIGRTSLAGGMLTAPYRPFYNFKIRRTTLVNYIRLADPLIWRLWKNEKVGRAGLGVGGTGSIGGGVITFHAPSQTWR